ncbi:MAG: PBP1A family penicillin-binding protein [Lachnospiraceae bacterium]|nr:PBP1A family penicillin-binding protein [Lachnospiraceae bacterium]
MNYSKQSVRRHKSGKSNTKRSARKKFGLTVLKSILVLILVLIAVGLGFFAYYAKQQIKELPDISDVNISPSGFQTKIVDSDGNQIETLVASGANRDYVSLSEIPLDLQHAFVAIEDSRFYEHNGVDVKGIIRAAFTGLANGGHFSQGASTITQQLLKNNFFTGWTEEVGLQTKIKRKIQEQYLALELEKVTSKDTILENYLNTINLGQNTLGVEAAAQRYFNKDTSDLTLSEDAVIAGITQNPARYNPITHPEFNAQRRKKVLSNMLEQGYINKSQYKEAMDDDVYDRIQLVNNDLDSSSTSYFVDALVEQVMDDLIEQKGMTETEAYMKLYSGGLTIHATQDPTVQKVANKEVANKANYGYTPSYSFTFRLTVNKADGTQENYSEQTMLAHYQASNRNYSINFSSKANAKAAYKKYKEEIIKAGDSIPEGGETITYTLQPQVAMTIMDQSTGQVKAIVGGRGKKKGRRTLNRATDITRQPGSTFKILAAYAPALDAGGMTLATVQDDAPTSYNNGRPIRNGGRYRGFTNIRTAITHSINVVTVKTLTAIGTGLGYQYVQDFGISTLDEGDNNQALALGGISRGVKNVELTGAYAAIANHGIYHRPVFYTTVEDNTGDIILDTTKDEGKQVIKETTAYLLTSAMQDVMTKGTGIRANFSGMAVAGKSGTTTKNRDCLFAGYTPYYTCVIWGGYDDNAPQAQNQTYYAKNIWRAVMSQINLGKENPGFAVPKGILRKAVCAKSGLLPEEGVCSNDPRGTQVYTEYFAKGTVPTKTCDHHVKLTVCKSSNLPAGEFCPEDDIEEKVFIIGASSGSEDSPFSISSNAMKSTCDVHTEKTREEEEKKKQKEKEKKKEKERKKREQEEAQAETEEETPAEE